MTLFSSTKHRTTLLLFYFLIFLFFPTAAQAEIGKTCIGPEECAAGETCATVILPTNFECNGSHDMCRNGEAGINSKCFLPEDCTDPVNCPQLHKCVIIDGTCQAAIATDTIATGETATVTKPTLQVAIPTLTAFDDVSIVQDEEGNSFALFPWLGQYINAIYLYLLGIAGLVAVIIFIHAGLEWMTSGGNAKSIDHAKGRIRNAVLGMIILFGSYTILSLINPDLVKFKNLKVAIIKNAPLDLVEIFHHIEDVTEESQEPGADALPEPGEQVGLPFPNRRLAYALVDPQPALKGGDQFINPPRPCTIPNPSLPAVYSGVAIDHSFLGKLDCNNSPRTKRAKRSPDNIDMVVLHEGFPGNNVKGMVEMWFSDYHYGALAICKKKKDGTFNYANCAKDKQLLRKPITLKQTPIGSHYAITPGGTVYQMADELFIMNHCCAANSHSIGIDLQTEKGLVHSEEKYKALAILIKGIADKYQFAPSDETIKAHCELGSHADPRNFNWQTLGKYLGVSLTPSAHNAQNCEPWPDTEAQSADAYADTTF